MIAGGMSRTQVLTDSQWGRIAPLMPSSDAKRGKRFRDHRLLVEGIIFRYRSGVAWRDLPGELGPWQTVWKRHRRFAGDGTWDGVLAVLLSEAEGVRVSGFGMAMTFRAWLVTPPCFRRGGDELQAVPVGSPRRRRVRRHWC